MSHFSAPEASAIAGVTYRQCDHWSRCGTLTADVEASGSGTARRYSIDRTCLLALAGELSALGATGKAIKVAVETVEPPDAWTWQTEPVVVDAGGRVQPLGQWDRRSGWTVDLALLKARVLTAAVAVTSTL